ncbi:MAG: hypothetical protein KME22_06660 [Hassallia sp. WJT32-NPBG1]|jgi:hypothetical protein|nr:hypothetical protein [Hassallia sp. WJT32-NPBG1]
MINYAQREIAKQDLEDRFRLSWRQQVPSLIKGFSESEYLIFENMFEMFPDLRELASYPATMPSLEYTFDRSLKMCLIKKSDRINKELVLGRFRVALEWGGVPEGRPNRYTYRRRLRIMACEIFSFMREKDSPVFLEIVK